MGADPLRRARDAGHPPGEPPARIPIDWRRRPAPLEPGAVLGRGPVAAALCVAVAARLKARPGQPAGIEVHAGGDVVLVIGQADALPWVDGATWLGWDNGLLVPTTLEAAPDPGLVARAVRRASPGASWIALTPNGRLEGERALDPPDVDRLVAMAARLGTP